MIGSFYLPEIITCPYKRVEKTQNIVNKLTKKQNISIV